MESLFLLLSDFPGSDFAFHWVNTNGYLLFLVYWGLGQNQIYRTFFLSVGLNWQLGFFDKSARELRNRRSWGGFGAGAEERSGKRGEGWRGLPRLKSTPL